VDGTLERAGRQRVDDAPRSTARGRWEIQTRICVNERTEARQSGKSCCGRCEVRDRPPPPPHTFPPPPLPAIRAKDVEAYLPRERPIFIHLEPGGLRLSTSSHLIPSLSPTVALFRPGLPSTTSPRLDASPAPTLHCHDEAVLAVDSGPSRGHAICSRKGAHGACGCSRVAPTERPRRPAVPRATT
jgi:hypothetical protein